MTGNLDLVNLDRLRFTPPKNGATVFTFFDDKNQRFPLTKQGGGFLVEITLITIFGGVRAMKNFLGIVETSPTFDRHIKAAEKLNSEIPSDSRVGDIPMEELPKKATEFVMRWSILTLL